MAESSKKSRIPYRTGDIFAIPLGTEYGYAYCRHLDGALVEFFELTSPEILPADSVLHAGIAFAVWVMDKSFLSGAWPKIGSTEAVPKASPVFFKQDPISKQLSLYQAGRERSATLAECEGLENAAVWSANHIEDRLRDHFAGCPNKWVQSLKPKEQQRTNSAGHLERGRTEGDDELRGTGTTN